MGAPIAAAAGSGAAAGSAGAGAGAGKAAASAAAQKSMDKRKEFASGVKAAVSQFGEDVEKNRESTESQPLMPMAQAAAALDMGFYGHMSPPKANKAPRIMGGQNGPMGGKNAVKKRK